MKFSIGDKVVIRHTKEEGVVISDEDKGMHMVRIKGVEIPVFKENMDHPYFYWFELEKEKKKNLKKVTGPQIPIDVATPRQTIHQGVFLGFFPVFDKVNEDEIEYFKLYIINQTAHYFGFEYRIDILKKNDFRHKGQLLPFTNFYVHNIDKIVLSELPNISIQLSMGLDKYLERDNIKLKPQKIAKIYRDLIQDGIAFSTLPLNYTIIEHHHHHPTIDKLGEKSIKRDNDIIKMKKLKPAQEIDLHIDKITDHYHHMSNAEMLTLQLHTFEKALSISIASKQDSLIVIHGVGKGKLKDEIHKMCRAEIMVRHYQNEWSPRYGYGATVIFLDSK